MTPTSDGQTDASGHVEDLPAPPALTLGPQTALFLDFDGTLVEIADHPDAVVVPEYLPDLLNGLSGALHGRLAIVTGRSIAAVEELTGKLDIAVAGSHGGEFRPAGSADVLALADPLPADVVAVLERCAHDNGGLLVEPKPHSVAVHYRHHPEAVDALVGCAQELSARFGLSLKHGKQVIELAMPGSDKGSAVARFMGLPAFRGAVPLFLGDDVTDEDAFRAARALGGQGVLVGPARPTAANFRLADVAHVRGWLKAGLDTAIKGDIHA